MSDVNLWNRVLDRLRVRMDPEEFRRWLAQTSYASDSGDQITVWVASEAARRHVEMHYLDAIDAAIRDSDRAGTRVRFVVTGYDDEEVEEGWE
jgi:chromosomal replication initiation ATPase DnaA